MAILHGEYFLELIIIFLLGLTSGSPLIKVFNLEDMELKESVVLNGFSGILDDGQTGSKCDIGNSSCGFHDMKKLVLCEEELKGIGSLNTTCQLNTSLQFDNDVLISGEGNLDILSHVSVGCPSAGCLISINISGDLLLGEYASLLAGTLVVRAGNLFLQNNSFLKTTALGGAPPPQTSGTPLGVDGAGGGHGGRGACCIKSDGKDPEDTWGGDAYAWSTLMKPWSHGSRGGTTSREGEFGGGGGGRVKIIARSILNVNGTISADGGDGGLKGGGGSGGSIIIRVPKFLEETLYGGKDKPQAHWKDTLKVAIGIAEALTYLHEGCSHPIIHRDVKSSNILLSEDFEPQLSDFGLAKWASTTSAYITCSDVVGTFGYLAPEYFMYGKVNEKTDVYSFGVVLLELITGRKPINDKNPKGQESLVMWARPLLAAGSVKELADPLLEDAYDMSEMKRMVIGAACCLRQAAQFRPRMNRILKLLRGEGDDLPYWTKRQLTMSMELDELIEDESGANSGSCDIQSHLSLAMLGVDDDVVSNSSPDQSVDLVHESRTLEDYFYGRYSRSASFD